MLAVRGTPRQRPTGPGPTPAEAGVRPEICLKKMIREKRVVTAGIALQHKREGKYAPSICKNILPKQVPFIARFALRFYTFKLQRYK